jgi:protein-S-isoprenylcysteine O-methyltransferase Ste14
MEAVAYCLALVSVMAVPAALAVWFVLRPFARWWRRVGPVGTYAAVLAVIAVLMWGIYSARGSLLRLHFGVRVPLVIASAVLFGLSLYMRVQIHRPISPGLLLGFPEISGRGPGQLVTSGIYARIRHPRYVGMLSAITAIALFTNYLASYMVAVVYVPLIYLVTVLEERELSARFGAAHREYCRRVPRFVPRLWGHGAHDGGGSA